MHSAEKRRRFDALARELGDDLFRFTLWLCGDRALAQDLVQETFLRAWKAIGSLKSNAAAKSWLITIVRREYARTFERKRYPTTSLDEMTGEVAGSIAPGPEAATEQRQLRQAIAVLDGKYREPLLLQMVMGMSIREIASQLELSESAVMTRVFRAREMLKQHYGTD